MNKIKFGRNDPCPCGSGQKYKRCCLETDQRAESAGLLEAAAAHHHYNRDHAYDLCGDDETDQHTTASNVANENSIGSIRSAFTLFEDLGREVDATLRRNIEVLTTDYSCGILHRIYEKAARHAQGCLVLVADQNFAATEALCRTLVESSVNLYYCSEDDSTGKILSYFKDHIETERKQNRAWRSAVSKSTMTDLEKSVHFERIDHKDAVYAAYEQFLQEAFGQIGYSYLDSTHTWPTIFDRFKAIGKDIDYRTIYAALCSQAHNDPEDLLNEWIHSVSTDPQAREGQKAKNENFAVFMLLASLGLLIESVAVYLRKYEPHGTRILDLLKMANDATNKAAIKLAIKL